MDDEDVIRLRRTIAEAGTPLQRLFHRRGPDTIPGLGTRAYRGAGTLRAWQT